MRRMNIATGLHQQFFDAVRSTVTQLPADPFAWPRILAAGREAVEAAAAEWIRDLQCEGLV